MGVFCTVIIALTIEYWKAGVRARRLFAFSGDVAACAIRLRWLMAGSVVIQEFPRLALRALIAAVGTSPSPTGSERRYSSTSAVATRVLRPTLRAGIVPSARSSKARDREIPKTAGKLFGRMKMDLVSDMMAPMCVDSGVCCRTKPT